MPETGYIGRFAPSPTGPLHAGSLLAALASWLHTQAHDGKWLVRIEDVDAPRCLSGMAEQILWQLDQCGLRSDGPVMFQSQRGAAYKAALAQLQAKQLAYACTCSRTRIAQHFEAQGIAKERFAALPYPGFCGGPEGASPVSQAAWRLRSGLNAFTEPFLKQISLPPSVKLSTNATNLVVYWIDERLGAQQQNLSQVVGDFVLKRADGLWAYQLAVVVDDAAQGITHVVRGEDLADNTPRQIWLQHCLGLPTPHYLHTPLILAADGQKLSKQSGAQAIDVSSQHAAVKALQSAGTALGLPMLHADSPEAWLAAASSHYTAAR